MVFSSFISINVILRSMKITWSFWIIINKSAFDLFTFFEFFYLFIITLPISLSFRLIPDKERTIFLLFFYLRIRLRIFMNKRNHRRKWNLKISYRNLFLLLRSRISILRPFAFRRIFILRFWLCFLVRCRIFLHLICFRNIIFILFWRRALIALLNDHKILIFVLISQDHFILLLLFLWVLLNI